MLKRSISVFSSFLTVFIMVFLVGCSDNDTSTGSGDSDDSTVPVVTTALVPLVTQTIAQCGGDVTSDGGFTVTARGVCWSSVATPTVADSKTNEGPGTASFTSWLTDLSPSTSYYVRAYATNSTGTGYGETRPFTTEPLGDPDSNGLISDIDGNVYLIIRIGDQWWMAENLRVTHYRNGDAITNVTDANVWDDLTSGAYCEYNNDESYVPIRGRLYNWYAVDDDRLIAPEGWHLPTDADWKELEMFLGMSQTDADSVGWRGTDEGGKLKEASTGLWRSPNTGATNQSGFSARPAGYRDYGGTFIHLSVSALFWSSTEISNGYAFDRYLYYDHSQISRGSSPEYRGASVRCVKD